MGRLLSTGLERLAEGDIGVVLLDLSLPNSQGLETFAKTNAQAPHVPIIVMTGHNDEGMAVHAVREGAQDYLVKGQMGGHIWVESQFGKGSTFHFTTRFGIAGDDSPQA